MIVFAKIVATLGPVSSEEEILKALLASGVSVFRLNFSHGTKEWHGAMIQKIRKISDEMKKPAAILQDLQGPKIRLGIFPDGPVLLQSGQAYTLTSGVSPCDARQGCVSYEQLASEASPGDRILINDGTVELKVSSIHDGKLSCEVVQGGWIGDQKGVNLPGMKLSTPALTEKDKEDLRFGLTNGVDIAALSFIRHPSDLDLAYQVMDETGKRIPLIAKLEKQEAIDNLDDILEKSYGVMVARGDLGVEVPFEELPLLQKKIIRKANEAGKPVITATQMLLSMVEHPLPTRAEITDVANAILDGTDAVMLSEETAAGKFPVQAVQTMAKIAAETQKDFSPVLTRFSQGSKDIPDAISAAACRAAFEIRAKALVAFTESGNTARNLSRHRPPVPIVAFAPASETCRKLNLFWGVSPYAAPQMDDLKELIRFSEAQIKKEGIAAAGEWAVIVCSSPLKNKTNLIQFFQIS